MQIFFSQAGRHSFHAVMLFFLFLFLVPARTVFAEQNRTTAPRPQGTGWSFPASGGYAYQPEVDLDEAGSFSVHKLYIQSGPSFSPDRQRSISLVVGYGFDGYDFSGAGEGTLPLSWGDIHSLRLSLPVRLSQNGRWTFLAVPSFRISGEDGAEWNDAATGGGFAGFSYRFSDRLSLGPGIGVFSQLEDSTSIFPVLLISWQITDRLSLSTGSGIAATRGPGLSLNWKQSERWELHAGGRYEKLRFRLGNDGPSPDGIGEDTSFPLFAGASCHFTERTRLTLLGGFSLAGELRLEDADGRLLVEDRYDPALFMGISFHLRL
jgi:hypothetical protein